MAAPRCDCPCAARGKVGRAVTVLLRVLYHKQASRQATLSAALHYGRSHGHRCRTQAISVPENGCR